MATHSSPLAWKIPRTEEPGRLQSMGSLGVGHNWTTSLLLFGSWRARYWLHSSPIVFPFLWAAFIQEPLAPSFFSPGRARIRVGCKVAVTFGNSVSCQSLVCEDQRKGIQASTLSWMRGKEHDVFFQDWRRKALCLPSGHFLLSPVTNP